MESSRQVRDLWHRPDDVYQGLGRTVLDLASEACLKAANDAGVPLDEIDGIISFNFNDSVPAIAVASSLGIPNAMHAVDYAAGGNGANLIVLAATAAIEAGLAKNVLVYRAMNGRSGFRLGGGRDMNARGITQYTAPFGWITYPQAMAMWCRRHMVKYGTTVQQLGKIAMTFRENASLNEQAMQRTPMTMDDYMSSRMIADPLRMLDICLESDGACAILVTGSDHARDLKHKPVYITGGAYGGGLNQGDDLFDALRWPDHSSNFAACIADDLWASAGLKPSDVDVAEIYDCFTYTVVMALEGWAFASRAKAVRLWTTGTLPAAAACRSTRMGVSCRRPTSTALTTCWKLSSNCVATRVHARSPMRKSR